MKKIAVVFCFAFLAAAMAQDAKPDAQPDVKKLEAGAVGVIRTLNTAEVTYAATYGSFSCSLGSMAVRAEGSGYTADHAGLIDNTIKDDKKRMYHFEVACLDGKPPKGYKTSATPLVKGARAFCSDQTAVIKFATDGKAKTCLEKGELLH
jgi:type IV pilus assembly protein PilA